jgi:hypothetical protein
LQPSGAWVSYASPTNYVYAGLYQFYDGYYGTDVTNLDVLRPFEENYLYRNFVFSTNSLNPDGTFATGLGWSFYGDITLTYPPAYQFQPPTISTIDYCII